ncbi:MAG: type IV pilus assembly protein PilM [Candidatus Kerfeldbacteria bacterium]|nr:type IV pilus assembly protein PilM [Candidatus Kerfeldbacteria bacterium]
MPFFTPKNQNVIGLELGSSAIKLVELEPQPNGHRLVTYGIAAHDSAAVRSDSHADAQETVNTLRQLLSAARVTTDRVVAALPAINVFHTMIEIPTMSAKELASAVQWEAKRMIPLPLDKMALDWHVVSPEPSAAGTITVVLTAAAREVVDRYVRVIKAADLGLVALETEINALQRSVLPADPDGHLVIDMGAHNANIVVFANHLPLIVRNLNIGISAIDEHIANALNISLDRASSIRRETTLIHASTANTAPASIKFIVESFLIKEIKRILSAKQTNVRSIILTGGIAHLPGITSFFSEHLSLPCTIGNTWQHVNFNPEMRTALDACGPELSVATGLALKTKTPT